MLWDPPINEYRQKLTLEFLSGFKFAIPMIAFPRLQTTYMYMYIYIYIYIIYIYIYIYIYICIFACVPYALYS